MGSETVYDADMWPVVACSERRTELCAWLRANNINPDDVPIGEDIVIEWETYNVTAHDSDAPQTIEGDRAIRYTAYLRNADGFKYLDEATGEPAQEERTVPLVVDPPPQWRSEKESDR
ncbi:hypothetical protein PV755_00275 [Streptomyces caniscabiei]|uniref:hypothetical protein n=1 Tax=Streptomyces caniscabiei TaxID=2746961 RepID=UPI0029B9944E|nr:hypothetical protein [Streptomyces caniscabiei]MDX3507370.1 hypothetical protein [Streptomyces caniscabiei]